MKLNNYKAPVHAQAARHHRLTLSNSEAATFRKCPNLWGMIHADGIVADREEVNAASWGSLYHQAQQAFWSGWRITGSPNLGPIQVVLEAARVLARSLATEQEEKLLEQADEVAWAMGRYLVRVAPLHDRIEVLHVEEQLTADVRRGALRHAVTPDLVYRDKQEGRIVIVDHKATTGDVQQWESRLLLDTQHVGYDYVIGKLYPGEERVFQWHAVRQAKPATPRVNLLKKGECSSEHHARLLEQQKETGEHLGYVSAAAIDTLPELYRGALEDQAVLRALPPTPEQMERLETLSNAGARYSQVTEHYVTQEQRERWEREFVITSKRIRLALADETQRTRSPEACSYPWQPKCSHRERCVSPGSMAGLRLQRDGEPEPKEHPSEALGF